MATMETPLPAGAVRGDGVTSSVAQSSFLSEWGLWGLTGPLVQGSWSCVLLLPWVWCGGQWGPVPCASELHPGWPTWQHMEMTHLHQPSPSSHQPHNRWFPCQRGQWHGQNCHWRMKICDTPNAFSTSATWGPRLMTCSSLFSFFLWGAISVSLLQPPPLESPQHLFQ